MKLFADPTHCPDCDSPLTPGSTSCPRCGLQLAGRLGAELFATLSRADVLLAQMRQLSLAAPAMAPAAAPAAAPTATLGAPRSTGTAPGAATAPGSTTRGSSVPQVLLALGAVCLLVAALVFLAVTWSVMGVGGRTATLVGLTLTTGLLTAWAARRGLRGATEALGVVTTGLAVLDLYGADNAGWLGNPSEAAMTALVGTFLVAGGLASARLLARTTAGGFTSGEVAVALGALLVSAGLASQTWGEIAVRQLLALCLVLALTAAVLGLVRSGSALFRVAAWALVPVLVVDWLALVIIGLDELGPRPTMSSAWAGLESWPLVAAGAVALLVAAAGRLPMPARLVSAAIGLVPLGLAALAPAFDESMTVVVLGVLAATVVVAALMALAPAPWGTSGLAVAALCAIALAVETLTLCGLAINRYAVVASAEWSGNPGGRLPSAAAPEGDAPWLLPICTAGLIALLWSAGRLVDQSRSVPTRSAVQVASAALGGSLVLTLLLHPVPVWTVLLALVLGSALAGWPAFSRDSRPAAGLAAAGLLAAVALSWYDEQLTTGTVAVALGLVTAAHLRTRHEDVATVAGGIAAPLLGGLVWSTGAVAGLDSSWTALIGLLLLSALALGRHALPLGRRTPLVDAVIEGAAGCTAVALASAALAATVAGDRSTWLAIYLTVAGAAVTLLALLRRDRRGAAWLGGLLLAAATWVRLADLGVDAPEPYTLPTALALLVVGLLRLRRDPSAGTPASLGAGLALALVPSLLWVVTDPGGLRSLVLGLACLALVVAGAQLRWTAPLAHGAVVGLAVVLVEAGPHIGDAVPRWGLIGGAGALLIALGITWEERLRQARLVTAYLREMR